MEQIQKTPVSEAVYNRLLSNIKNNIWNPGEKLPSENELCRQLGVSRISVRDAMHRLKAIGLIETKQGLGSFVVQREAPEISGFDQELDLSEKEFNEINELREVIETKALQLIASRRGEVNLDEIESAYHAMKEALKAKDAEAYTQQDYRFHMAIVHACGNDLFYQIACIFRIQYFKYFREMNRFIFENSTISDEMVEWCNSEYDSHSMVYNFLFNNSPDDPSVLTYSFTSGNKKRFETYLQNLEKKAAHSRPISYYVGTYSYPVLWGDGSIYTGNGKGISRIELDEETGTASLKAVEEGIRNPSHICINGDMLYCVNELDQYEGNSGGAVSIYHIEKDFSLSLIEQMYTRGESPCNVEINKANGLLCISNFNGGSLFSIPLNEAGLFSASGNLLRHTGAGSDPVRQSRPHVHSTCFSDDGEYAIVADLGLDKVSVHKVADHTLDGEIRVLDTPPGSGPRMIRYNRKCGVWYVLCEMSNILLVYGCDENGLPGILLQTISTLPDNCTVSSTAADIAVSADGRWVYASNRGHNSIAAYQAGKNGLLSFKGTVSCMGDEPRSICISPSGKWLSVCNQNSDSIAVFSLTNGIPEYTSSLAIPTPTCMYPLLQA